MVASWSCVDKRQESSGEEPVELQQLSSQHVLQFTSIKVTTAKRCYLHTIFADMDIFVCTIFVLNFHIFVD